MVTIWQNHNGNWFSSDVKMPHEVAVAKIARWEAYAFKYRQARVLYEIR